MFRNNLKKITALWIVLLVLLTNVSIASSVYGLSPSNDASTIAGEGLVNDYTPTAGTVVYITDTGTKYHLGDCRFVENSKIPIGLDDAISQGYGPCKVCNPPTKEGIFKDVPHGHDFYYTIRNIVSKGIMRGKGDGKYFGTADKLTRAEASVALVRAAGLKPIRGNAFSDVPFDHWANAFINAAAKAGILRGKGKGESLRFAPDDNITRAELAVMVSRAFSLKKDSSNVKKFSDVLTNHWAYNFINNLTSNGIVGGYPDGRFGPEDPVTRGQFTVFVWKSMNRK